MPIYIAQKDAPGGLHWEQSAKGIIFLIWAFVQNLTPLFAGSFADKFGHKKVLSFSFILIILGYILIATQREFVPFLLSALILALGSGIFRPSIHGSLSTTLNNSNRSTGWALNTMLINASILFAGPYLLSFLKGFDWTVVFIGCGVVVSLNYIFILFLKPIPKNDSLPSNPLKLISEGFRELKKPGLLSFILLMSGFTMIYMQFYETLPNFIYDWSDTSGIASALGLSEKMTLQTGRGDMLSLEWIYAMSSGMIVVGVVLVSLFLSNKSKITSLVLGMLTVTTGLILAGLSMSGGMLLAGILVYTLGEMISNPKFNETLSHIAPPGKNAIYMSFLNISWAIGLGGGSILGGWIYGKLGEKSTLAMKYLSENYPDKITLNQGDAVAQIINVTGMTDAAVTEMLWGIYHPWTTWIPFVAIGFSCALWMLIRFRKNKAKELLSSS